MENREIEAIVREVLKKAAVSQAVDDTGKAAVSQVVDDTGKAAVSQAVDGTGNAVRQGSGGKNLTGMSRQEGTGTISPGTGHLEAAKIQVSSAYSESVQQKNAANLVSANGGLVHASMPLALAVKLIEKIEAKAAEWDMRVVTAVSDASARPVAIHCMDGAYIGSYDVALNKTYTSIAFQMSTAQLGTLSRPGESLYGIQFTNNGKIVIFGGGEVLKKNGIIVGALGVSGGSAEQDTALAAYGKSVFETL